ncbi:hypothetical protein HanXRQr2_Chr03g0098921 [Helianthus annuus]|uniref:Uncharacterized protein n=1 Tax=Helianthus annuus TaxID=4232 RepID=A0A9K3JDK3_HELAN|nr:hypothetical protein HanXRQr2_Chr03g0098921 [Helianthus annuus]
MDRAMRWMHQYNLELLKINHMVLPGFHLSLLVLERLPHTILVIIVQKIIFTPF